ncbi:MAG: hypothetical protein HQL29_02265, partial [Candidatus Omnitrophica bacterium]|nr:hypothetical protein [Candidatus Omnitrophota bacterium]
NMSADIADAENLTLVGGQGNTFNTRGFDITLSGDVNIGAGTTFSAVSTSQGYQSLITIDGDWINNGTFVSGLSRVAFSADSVIVNNGEGSFHNVSLAGDAVQRYADSINISGAISNLVFNNIGMPDLSARELPDINVDNPGGVIGRGSPELGSGSVFVLTSALSASGANNMTNNITVQDIFSRYDVLKGANRVTTTLILFEGKAVMTDLVTKNVTIIDEPGAKGTNSRNLK